MFMGNYSIPHWEIPATGPDGLLLVAHIYLHNIPLMGRYFISVYFSRDFLPKTYKNNQFCIKQFFYIFK